MSQRNPSPSHRHTLFGSVKRMVLCAMMVAMSVVIGTICKNYLNFADGLLRITFENLPILLAGIFLGPVAGGMVGVTADLVSYLLSSQAYPPNPVVTLGACAVGVVAGLMAKYVIKTRGIKQIILSSLAAHVVGSMIIKTLGLFAIYQWAVLIRIPVYLVISTLEIILLCTLWRQRSFRQMLENL